MRSRTLGIVVLSAGALSLSLSITSNARADDTSVVLGVDGDIGVAPDGEDTTGGGGGALRLGGEREFLAILYVRPELGAHYHEFGGERAPSLWRGIGGIRAGLDLLIRVGAFAHAGYAWFDSPVADESRDTFTYDLGAELGLSLLPILNLGLHYAYVNIGSGDAPRPFDFSLFGVHAELVF